MKSIFFALSLGLIMLFSALSSVFGIGIMLVDLYTSGENFMQGFTVFFLGTICFFVCTIAYICTKISSSLEIISDSLIRNQFESLKDMFSTQSTLTNSPQIQVTNIEDGALSEELLRVLFGKGKAATAKKELVDMTLEELEIEKNKAIDSQDYEKCAHIRQLIEEKNKNKKD